MKICGIDPSTSTGVVFVDHSDEATCLLASKLLVFSGDGGFRRVQLIAQSVDNLIEELKPDLVCIEGYAYGMFGKSASVVTLVEIGAIIRHGLYQRKLPWYDVPPTVLKKFCTGKGNAKKLDMAVSVHAKWDFRSDSDDVIDAYALARFGAHLSQHGSTGFKGVVYNG